MSAVLILIGCGLVPVALTAWLGRTAGRVVAIGAFGVIAAGALVAFSLATAPTSVEAATCHHCGEYMGRWVDPLALIFPAVLVTAWVVGVAIGTAVRASRRSSLRP